MQCEDTTSIAGFEDGVSLPTKKCTQPLEQTKKGILT